MKGIFMSTPSISAPVLLEPVSPVQKAVSAQFASRARIDTVIRQMLTAALHERFPTLTLDLSSTRLATPRVGGGWELPLFIDRVLAWLVDGASLDISHVSPHNYYFLSDPEGNRLKLAQGYEIDMKVVETLVKELSWSVPIGLKSALSQYWSEQTENGISRWRWLSNVLKDTLAIKAVQQTDFSDAELETLRQVLDFPDGSDRVRLYGDHATRVYYVQTTLTFAGTSGSIINPHLLLVRYAGGQNVQPLVMMCLPDGAIETFSSVQAVAQSRAALAESLYVVEAIVTKHYEIDGDAFDAEAALILSRHMSRLSALKLPTQTGLQALESVCFAMTDTSSAFLNAPTGSADTVSRLQSLLPQWLAKASAADQALYRSWSLALANAKKSAQGQSYLTGIADIHRFTIESLKRQLERDQQRFGHQQASELSNASFEPDDIELTFLLVAGTLAPGSTHVSGIAQQVKMTLTELALNNLSGKPRGEIISVMHRQGLALPVWLTAHYITQRNGLIETVDIGRYYPETLKRELLGDGQARMDREKLFTEQLRWQLPLQALELSLKNESGITPEGARYVAAVMQTNADARRVDGQEVVIRHLALLSHSEAKPDIVSNMFIIESMHLDVGPCVLYRPLYDQSLLEFASRDDLMRAIAQSGALQTSVLTWLTDAARTMYDNEGFKEPHYVRFTLEDDFPVSAFVKPQPASLAVNGVNDELMQHLQNGTLLPYLYQFNALSLTHQADRDTVSNRESRWRIFLEGANLFLNIFLLPYLRGPVMLTAWFVLLLDALRRDIPALHSDDPVTRELALVDVLQNLAMVLFQWGPAFTASPTKPGEGVIKQLRRAGVPRRAPQEWPPRPSAKITEGPVVLAGEWEKRLSKHVDFSFSNATNRLTPNQRRALQALAVPAPEPLPSPEQSGGQAGLYNVQQSWYALIDEGFYPVRIEADQVVIVGGPHLQRDRAGRWSLDLRLRLRGGGPTRQVAALRARKAKRIAELDAEYTLFLQEHKVKQKKIMLENTVLKAFENDPRRTEDEVLDRRAQFLMDIESETNLIERVVISNQERNELGVGFTPEHVIALIESVINNASVSLSQIEKIRVIFNARWAEITVAQSGMSGDVSALNLASMVHFRAHMKALVDLNDQSIRMIDTLDRNIAELSTVGPKGVEAAERLRTEYSDETLTSLQLKSLQIVCLKTISLKTFATERVVQLNEHLEPLREQIQTHDQLNKIELDARERLDVLGSLLEQYGKALDALLNIQKVSAEELEGDTYQRLIDLVAGFYKDVEQQLAAELKPLESMPVKIKKNKPKLSERPLKRIIKTRNKGQLIGDLKLSTDGAGIETIEVRSDRDNELFSTYIRDGDTWNAVPVERPAEPLPFKRSLSDIKGEARKLHGMAQVHLTRAEGLLNSARYPQEAEETLVHVADRLNKSASELERVIGTDTESWRQRDDQELVGSMRERALDMRAKAFDLRIRLSLKLPPTHGNLQYLLELHRVTVSLFRARKRLKRDFIDEYAIKDTDGNFLWCAHFHYKDANKAKNEYEVAHLKVWSQRTDDYWALKENARNQYEVVEVYRSEIGRDLAQRWFLPLAP